MLLVLAACGARDISDPVLAIQGHWLEDDGFTHVYIGQRFVYEVMDDFVWDDYRYEVLNSNVEGRWVEARTEGHRLGADRSLMFVLDEDGRGMIQRWGMAYSTGETRLTWVDGKTEP